MKKLKSFFLTFSLILSLLLPLSTFASTPAEIKFIVERVDPNIRLWFANSEHWSPDIILDNPNNFSFYNKNGVEMHGLNCLWTSRTFAVECNNPYYRDPEYDYIRVVPKDLELFYDANRQYTYTSFTQDPPPEEIPIALPVDAYFETTEVQSWAVSWNMTLKGNQPMEIDERTINIWNHFEIISSTPHNNDIILQIKQFDGQRLSVECASYELTVPPWAIMTQGVGWTNNSPISWSFTVTGCPNNTQNPGQWENPNNPISNNHQQVNVNTWSTLSSSGVYLSIIETDENGKQYINLMSTFFLAGLISFSLFIFWLFFTFIKQSFLWKK